MMEMTKVKSYFTLPKFEHLAAGVVSGSLSTITLHPLDVIKVRLAVDDGKSKAHKQYRGLVNATSCIYKYEGFSGFYKGITPNIVGNGASWGLYFFFFQGIKSWMQGGDATVDIGPIKHMLAGGEAGILTLSITNPIWITKTRLILQYEGKSRQQYKGMVDAIIKIYKREGLRGLYKGFVPGIFGVSHGALQFMAYEEMKTAYNKSKNRSINYKLHTYEYIVFSALSKIIAVVATYPYQVLRCRLQDQHSTYNGVIDVIKKTAEIEGARGFYKGMFPSLLRVTPATAITFAVYEKLSQYLINS